MPLELEGQEYIVILFVDEIRFVQSKLNYLFDCIRYCINETFSERSWETHCTVEGGCGCHNA